MPQLIRTVADIKCQSVWPGLFWLHNTLFWRRCSILSFGCLGAHDNKIGPFMCLKEHKVLIFWNQSTKEYLWFLLTSGSLFNSASVQIHFQTYLHYKYISYNLEDAIFPQYMSYLQFPIVWPLKALSWKESEIRVPEPALLLTVVSFSD